jgi:hypothetical protein
MMENVIASLLEADQSMAIEAFVEQVADVDELIRKIGLDTVKEVLGEYFEPDDVFTYEELNEWALENLKEEDFTLEELDLGFLD